MRAFILALLCGFAVSNTTVFEFTTVDYVWKSEDDRLEAIRSKQYIPEHNSITGVKVYNHQVYVTVPRWKLGVPSTLNRVVEINGVPLLDPFPDWNFNLLGSCDSFQFVQSMEIDPSGRMWIIDTGKAEGFPYHHNCPAKIVIFDIKNDKVVRRYDFPFDVVPLQNFLNDIVLDIRSPEEIYAFITDANSGTIVVYDFKRDKSWKVYDKTMQANKHAESLLILGESFNLTTPVDGIALGPTYQNPRLLYYCPLASFDLYSVPVETMLRSPLDISKKVVKVGAKRSQSDGLIMSNIGELYYGSLAENAVYKWDIREPLNKSHLVASDDHKMQWVDTFAIDEDGYLWYTSTKLHLFFLNKMDFNVTADSNFRIMKVRIPGLSYLIPADESLAVTHPAVSSHSTASKQQLSLVLLLFCCLIVPGKFI